MAAIERPLAIVTGASTGIGLELAKQCAAHSFDLLIAANEPEIHEAADYLRHPGVQVDAIEVDLANVDGVDALVNMTRGRSVEALLANAGCGQGGGFLDQEFTGVRHVIDTNITGTIYLIQQIGRQMRNRRRGRILVTGSIAGYMPGTFLAVYSSTKAFINSFCYALREELNDSGVSVTCLMPGATETSFFARAGMLDTEVGQEEKDDPAAVAEAGFEAMMRGDAEVVTGWKNKLQSTIANVVPSELLAKQHRRKAEPGGARR